jgi:hypothetical protein
MAEKNYRSFTGLTEFYYKVHGEDVQSVTDPAVPLATAISATWLSPYAFSILWSLDTEISCKYLIRSGFPQITIRR